VETGDRPQCSDECREALRRLGALLDGELGDVTQAQLEQHLADCEPCTDRRDFEEGFRELVRRGCADEAPPHLKDRILRQLDEIVTG
jgi:mycothiol system anti-sigma-R factor